MAYSTSSKTCSSEVKMALICEVFLAWGWKRAKEQFHGRLCHSLRLREGLMMVMF